MKKKPNSYVIHVVITSLSLIIGIPLFLLFYNVIGNSFQSVLKIQTDASFSGGKVATVFHDPVGDDYGFGELTYPDGAYAGSLDLIRYTVHRPVRFSRSSGWRSFWQLDFSFKSPGLGRNIKVYFGRVDTEKGSTETQVEFAENVTFSPAAPWEFVISIKDDSGTIESFDRPYKRDLKIIQSKSGKDIYARISLADSELKFLHTLPECNHYVLIGALDLKGRDGFAEVSYSDFIPRVYDILAPDGCTQEELLSAWDEDDFLIPVMQPVPVRLSDHYKDAVSGKTVSEETLATLRELEKAAAEEASKIEASSADLYASKPADPLEYAIAAFDANKLVEAENLFGALVANDKNSIPAIAYTGAVIALRASVAPPLEAVGIVKDAYVWLDRAVAQAVTEEDRLYAYMNRGHVSLAVPNTIFGMAEHGGDDFIRAAEAIQTLMKRPTSENNVTIENYVNAVTKAARCYQIADEITKAETWYREARRLLDTIPVENCAQERLDVFTFFEVGSGTVAKSVDPGKKEAPKTTKTREKEQKAASEAELEKLLAEIDSGSVDLKKIEAALRLQVMDLENLEAAIKFARRYEKDIVDSQAAQLLVAVAECKMAGIVKKTVDKVDWVNTGMRRFDKVQRRWPETENVYLFQTLTYSNFPSELGMLDQVIDLLDKMTGLYARGTWNVMNAPVDLLWDVWINLGNNYPRKTEKTIIRARAQAMSDTLVIMKKSKKAAEVLHE